MFPLRTGIVLAVILASCLILSSCGLSPQRKAELESRWPPEKPYDNSVFVQSGKARWHLRLGEPTGEPRGLAVLLHGFGSNTATWDTLAPALVDQGWRVLAIDYPPFGYSQAEPGFDYGTEHLVRQISTLTGDYRIKDKPLAVLGHSLGGRLATAWAQTAEFNPSGSLEHPDSLILVAPAIGKGGGANPALAFPLWSWAVEGIVAATLFDEKRLIDTLSSAKGRPARAEEAAPYLAPTLLPGKARQFVAFAGRSPEQALDDRAPTIPTLVIWGTKDSWVPYEETWPLWKERNWAASERLIEGAGHVPQETHQDAVVDAVLGYLAQLSGPEGSTQAKGQGTQVHGAVMAEHLD